MDIKKIVTLPQTLFTRVTTTTKLPKILSTVFPRDIPISQATNQALNEEGKNEQTIIKAAKIEEDKQTVDDLIRKSNRCIVRISAIFPWDFFPDTIEVEESRVTYIFHQLLGSQTHSVEIKDISNVILEKSPFFATLQLVSRTFVENNITIGHLNPKKALQVKTIIEGLRTFNEHDIDTSNYEIEELIAKIHEFHTNKAES